MKMCVFAAGVLLGLSACSEAASGDLAKDDAAGGSAGGAAPMEVADTGTLEAVPEPFLGKWESSFAPDNCRAEHSSERLLISEGKLQFSEAAAQFDSIERIDARTIEATATVSTYDGESKETYRLMLGEDGEILSLTVEGLDEPFDYVRCPAP